MDHFDPMQAARRAAVEGALAALLIEYQHDGVTRRDADGIRVTLTPEGTDVEVLHDGLPVTGEGW